MESYSRKSKHALICIVFLYYEIILYIYISRTMKYYIIELKNYLRYIIP